ncbi:MAG TPA: sialidase family protein [Acidimicrobiia bacterium]|nr:sialidase family protein [Acidimicrobiia bacterium]
MPVVASSAPVGASPTSGAAGSPTEVNVSNDPAHRYGEPEIAIDPKNPNHLVYAVLTMGTTYACQRANRPACQGVNTAYAPQPRGLIDDVPAFSQVRVYVSLDRGKTWRRSADVPAFPPGHTDLVERGDPLITAGPDGTFYLAWDDIHFANLPTTIIRDAGIAVSKSTDGGRTWSKPVLTGTPVDRPFFAADLSTGMIYETSTGALGANSKADQNLPPSPIGGPGNDRWLVASRDGRHWSDPKPFGGVAAFPPGTFVSAARGVFATAFATTNAGLCGGRASCTVFQTTTDAAATWSRHVLPVAAGSTSAPLVAADPSTSGHFAVAGLNPTGTQFVVYQTRDAGTTWTGPTIVAEDATKTHFHPWLTYSPTGVLGLMWQTNVTRGPTASGGLPAVPPREAAGEVADQAAGPPSPYNVWAATSDDGGATFNAPLQISKAESPAPQEFLPFGVGDDFSFLSLSGSYAFIAWADYRPGDRSAFFSAVKLSTFKANATSR